jgi:hypothetical protein
MPSKSSPRDAILLAGKVDKEGGFAGELMRRVGDVLDGCFLCTRRGVLARQVSVLEMLSWSQDGNTQHDWGFVGLVDKNGRLSNFQFRQLLPRLVHATLTTRATARACVAVFISHSFALTTFENTTSKVLLKF